MNENIIELIGDEEKLTALLAKKYNVLARYDELVRLLNRAQLTEKNYNEIKQLILKHTLDCDK